MTSGRRGTAAGQDECLERRQALVEPVQFRFEPIDMRRVDHDVPGDAQLAAEIEQVVLNFGQGSPDFGGQTRVPEYDSYRAIGFIDRAIGFNAQILLGHARAVAEAPAAVIAGARINFAEAVTHDFTKPSIKRR